MIDSNVAPIWRPQISDPITLAWKCGARCASTLNAVCSVLFTSPRAAVRGVDEAPRQGASGQAAAHRSRGRRERQHSQVRRGGWRRGGPGESSSSSTTTSFPLLDRVIQFFFPKSVRSSFSHKPAWCFQWDCRELMCELY